MIVEVQNLVTGERLPVLAETAREAVVTAAAEARIFAGRTFHSFRQLAKANKLAGREAARLRKHEVRRGHARIFCGNWMASVG